MFSAVKKAKLSNVVGKHLEKLIEIKEKARQDKKSQHESAMNRLDALNEMLHKLIEKETKK